MAETVYLVGLIYGSDHNMAGCACTFKTLIVSMIQDSRGGDCEIVIVEFMLCSTLFCWIN